MHQSKNFCLPILISADERDEIDIELLGGIPAQWQTNVFAPTPKDPDPHYGRFSSDEDVPGRHISSFHTYSIDWDAVRIIWSVDGNPVRTLTKGACYGQIKQTLLT